ncbi:MAG TPA: hypoxanthine phosphoribosyltransferase [Deltaproteobacteria bacterium]|nr:hypoxanthine phosphoribosyltransferase [Deltaproteobacteria bacterium]
MEDRERPWAPGGVEGGLTLLKSREEIGEIVGRLASRISADYGATTPVLVGILKGSFVFLADLCRALSIPHEVDFIRTSSYGRDGTPSSEVHILKDTELAVEGRHVIVVEDIVDRGATLTALLRHMEAKRPASIRVCALLRRAPAGPGPLDAAIHYLGAVVGEGFVVGYGMDYREGLRGLPDLYTVGRRGHEQR